MSNYRITDQNLNSLLQRMAAITGGTAGKAWTKTDAGCVAVVGALVVEKGSRLYGLAWTVSQMVNEQGGQSDILRAKSATDLFLIMLAWLAGAETVINKRA